MLIFILTGTYLSLCSYTDLRYKKINIPLSAITGFIGLACSVCSLSAFGFNHNYSLSEHTSFLTLAISICVSIFMLIVSRLTKGSVGTGDCIMLAVLSCYLSPGHIVSVLLYGLIFSGIIALFLLIIKKYTRKDTLPFAPFLLSGHICCFLLFYL